MPQLLAHLFGDYILQSDWMAQGKTKASWPALAHALLYSLCFVPLCWMVTVYSYSWEQFDSFYLERLHGQAHHFHWVALLVIFSTHFLIDRFRLARYVVWAKNWLGPRRMWLERRDYKDGKDGEPFLLADLNQTFNYANCSNSVIDRHWINPPLHHCPTGYPSTTPIWLSTWLLIIADNTLHLAINYAALRWL